ncbi:hypothetical protein EPUS_03661 [Endocarpon pusillum Z07020]|uniref:Uncharacterized protein n=1 Tax=Endocarpon pusillum (strain Z07020 / HMAS-L-300199) TaxID=1263415 RepID=U1HL32_ENDPU|nr:uncharacterized protein EPUS_03661 [Endocarpon pusillum Z07020]ERF69669.1 hypothetical protein EPUS_03661 [Endocarpon pusillum Z07020]
MCGQDRHQPTQNYLASTSKALEAGSHPYNSLLHTSTGSSSSSSSFASSSTSSQTPSIAKKKRKWYKPKLRLKLHADWMWVGFISAGNTTPTGQCRFQNGGQEDDEEWEQLPAYTPPEEGGRGLVGRFDGNSRNEQDEWLVEPPSTGPNQARRNEFGLEPPEYQ